MKNRSGFTLIELLIAIGIIAILAGAVVQAINPGRIFRNARNSERETHVQTIYSGFDNYHFQNDELPDCIGGIPEDASVCEDDLVPTYLSSLPQDSHAGDGLIGYEISKSSVAGEICVEAIHAEGEEEIFAGICED